MTDFRKIFIRKKNEQDNRLGICEQRINFLEDQLTNLKKDIINSIIDVIKRMR